MTNIANNLNLIHTNIATAAKIANRPLDGIKLLAVSKTRLENELRQVWAEGQRDFGENYLQEALDKIDALADLDICWHFIGPIQSNKTRPIAENFDWVHSVDRFKIAPAPKHSAPKATGSVKYMFADQYKP